jgi:acetyltransferase-like isoleucine patch superfamily enzyme
MKVNIKIGINVIIIEPVNLYGCELKDDVFIGPFVEIQNDTIIGKGTRIQSHSFICSKTKIGENCFIGHGVMFTNDKFHNKKIARLFLPTNIGNNVLIGSNSTILPVKICNDVVIGAGSVITKDITIPGVYAGNPAKKIIY